MNNNALQVGYARFDITPQESVPLAGYGNTSTRMSQNILSPLCTTCIAFTDDEGSTVLMYHNDLISSAEEFSIPIRTAISEATGIPFSHVLMAATHTHSAPDLMNTQIPSIPRYIEYLKNQMVACGVEALADRKPAQMYIAKGKTQGLNFVRHYVLEDGTYKGDNFGDLNPSPYAGHTTEADPELRLVKFTREGGKDVLLVNWQSHPHRTGGSRKYDVSADIVGVMRDELEAALDCNFIYFTGGGGNINPHSRIKEENITKDFLEQGKALAKHALDAVPSFTPVQTGKVRLVENIHMEPLNRPSGDLLAHAQEVRALWVETNDFLTCVKLANQYGINSPYAAGALIGRYNTKADLIPVPFYAFSIGDVGFVTAPYEMFDTNAKYVRDFSPFKMTIVASCANDADSYVPSAYGYIHGCYETDCALFAPGAGERFARMLVNMLKELQV